MRYVEWRKPNGATELVILVGSVTSRRMGLPWNIVEGSAEALDDPDSVFIDALYAGKLGFTALGQEVEIRGRKARIAGLTDGIRTFTQSPYVFTSYNNALKYTDVGQGDESYVLVRTTPDADIGSVVDRLRREIPDADVMTSARVLEAHPQLLDLHHGRRPLVVARRHPERHRRRHDRGPDPLRGDARADRRICHAQRHRGAGPVPPCGRGQQALIGAASAAWAVSRWRSGCSAWPSAARWPCR